MGYSWIYGKHLRCGGDVLITVEVSGTLPKIPTDFTPIMDKVSTMMLDSVRLNFVQGGRPQTWLPLKKTGEASYLFQSGALLQSIQRSFASNFAEVGTDVFYGKFLQFGTRKMVARPFMLFQDEDVSSITALFGSELVKFINAGGETL
jgi:phage gpG-like protein